MKYIKILPFLSFALFFVSCAKDKTVDQYRSDIEAAHKAQIDAVGGTYRGSIVNSADGNAIGAMEAALKTIETPVATSDTTTTGLQASLGGNLTLYTSSQSRVSIQSASYNDTTGAVNGKIFVTLADKSTIQMTISGTISGNNFSGDLQSDNSLGITGHFNLVKDAALPSAGQADAGANLGSNFRTYVGPLEGSRCLQRTGNCAVVAKLTTSFAAPNSQEEFVDNFLQLRPVSIQVTFEELIAGKEQMIDSFNFDNAQYDSRAGKLTGHVTYNANGVTSVVDLNCVSASSAAQGDGWRCNYVSHYNGVNKPFTAFPVK